MSSISDLALKGHFEELKKKFDRKGMVKSAGNGSKDLLNIISKAVSIAEDMYEHDPSFFTEDYLEDYRIMISKLQENGYTYNGHPDLMDRQSIEKQSSFPKKPMQKAGVKESKEKKNRKTG